MSLTLRTIFIKSSHLRELKWDMETGAERKYLLVHNIEQVRQQYTAFMVSFASALAGVCETVG